MRRLLSLLLVAVLAGCSGGDSGSGRRESDSGRSVSRVSRGAAGDCIRAWNAAGNAETRAEVRAKQRGWAVEVSRFQVSHPVTGPSADDLTGAGCSYFLRSHARWKSYGGSWEADGDLRWGTPVTSSGTRTPQQTIQPPNAVLVGGGQLVELPERGPVADREWRDVIDDWYDNGEFDEAHRCAAVRAALDQVPSGRDINTAQEDLNLYADRVCA